MAHMETCGKAVKMMSKIELILDKFDSDRIEATRTKHA